MKCSSLYFVKGVDFSFSFFNLFFFLRIWKGFVIHVPIMEWDEESFFYLFPRTYRCDERWKKSNITKRLYTKTFSLCFKQHNVLVGLRVSFFLDMIFKRHLKKSIFYYMCLRGALKLLPLIFNTFFFNGCLVGCYIYEDEVNYIWFKFPAHLILYCEECIIWESNYLSWDVVLFKYLL